MEELSLEDLKEEGEKPIKKDDWAEEIVKEAFAQIMKDIKSRAPGENPFPCCTTRTCSVEVDDSYRQGRIQTVLDKHNSDNPYLFAYLYISSYLPRYGVKICVKKKEIPPEEKQMKSRKPNFLARLYQQLRN